MPELLQIITTFLWFSFVVSMFVFAALTVLDFGEERRSVKRQRVVVRREWRRHDGSGD